MAATLRKIKPGWYLLVLLLIYSIIVTIALQRANNAMREYRTVDSSALEEPAAPPPTAPEGLWIPIPGAELPQTTAYLPGAPRSYRQGVNQGFDFYGGDAGIPIDYGTPVISAADGVVIRADMNYQEPQPEAWAELMAIVAERGATETQLDTLRGRQVWIETNDGLTLRYAHLSAIEPGLEPGTPVYRGQVIGYVGNSGTDDGVAGTNDGARLHFEIWREDGTFWGQGLNEAALRVQAASLFVGP